MEQNMNVIGTIKLNGKKVVLLVGVEDHKWYKARIKGEYQEHPERNSVKKLVYEGAIPVTEKEFNFYFIKG